MLFVLVGWEMFLRTLADLLLPGSKVCIDVTVPWKLLLLNMAKVLDERTSEDRVCGLCFVYFGDSSCADYVWCFGRPHVYVNCCWHVVFNWHNKVFNDVRVDDCRMNVMRNHNVVDAFASIF